MKDFRESKIATLLASFDTNRFERFALFIHSPYFNSSETIRAVFDALKEHHPDFDPTKCQLQVLHRTAFGSRKKYDYHRISNVLSDIYELALRFLVQISRDDQDEMDHWKVLPRLREARLDKQFEQQLKRVDTIFSQHENDDFYHINRNYYFNELIWYSSSHDPEKRFEYLQQQYDSILRFVLIRLGRLTTLLKFEEYQSSVRFNLAMLEEFLHFFESERVPEQPVVQLFRVALLLVVHHRDTDYFQLRTILAEHRGFFTISDVTFATQFLTHHVLYQLYENGSTALLPTLVDDKKELLRSGQYRVQKVVPFADFVFLIRIASLAGEIDWAHEIISTYLHLVIPEEQENCRAFALAAIARAMNDYRTALRYISQVHFRSPILAIQVRDMIIMLQYEVEEFEQCLYSLDSFRHYIKSLRALPPRYIEAHQDFIRLTKRLVSCHAQARSPKRQSDLKKLKVEIAALPYNTLSIRSWLTSQCEALR